MRPLRAIWLLGLLAGVAGAESFEILFGEDGPRRREVGGPAQLWLVAAPVADLRREPVPLAAVGRRPYPADPLQETQVFFGEPLEVYEARDGWLRVEAPAQPEFTHEGRWQGYPGWVRAAGAIPWPKDYLTNAVVIKRDAHLWSTEDSREPALRLPMGSRVSVLYLRGKNAAVIGPRGQAGKMRSADVRLDRLAPAAEEDRRVAALEAARQFLGGPYLWGGRTASRSWEKNRPSGIDCSGLVHVAHAASGLRVPRDAHEQFMAARPVASSADLKPGDLVFLAKAESPERIVHVMIFEHEERLIEAVEERGKVRRVTFRRKLGLPRHQITPKRAQGGVVVYLGSLLRETSPARP